MIEFPWESNKFTSIFDEMRFEGFETFEFPNEKVETDEDNEGGR